MGEEEEGNGRPEMKTKRKKKHNSRVIRRMSSCGEEVQALQKLRIGEEGRRDRMLAWTLNCATGVSGGPACALVSNRHHRQPSVPSPVIREMALAPFGRGNLCFTSS